MHLGAVSGEVKNGLNNDIQALKSKAVEFNAAAAALERARPDPQKFPKEFAKWRTLKQYGDQTRASVRWLTGAVDTAGNVIDSIAHGLKNPFGFNVFGLNGLGVLPLIPVAGVAISGAVIASSIAAMTYFISSAYEYGKFADSTPEVRAELQKRAATGGLQGAISGISGLLILGLAVYLLPRYLKGRK